LKYTPDRQFHPLLQVTILDLLLLNDPQLEAATATGDLVVAAGAGSGKTRTLVGRYLGLLESGVPLRAIAAITFTDKAAREMRTRVRQTIAKWLQTSEVSETSEVYNAP
jgi:ATP-dependent exoDNAse (exonuclease V) beta subunit